MRFKIRTGLSLCCMTIGWSGMLWLCLSVRPLNAQASFAAQLSGIVHDNSGAAVPSASVVIANDATGVTSKIQSDGSGRYTVNNLQPASYTITVEAKGFSKLVQSGIVLRVSQQSVLDLTLQVGTASTQVEVRSDTVLLDSANAELGQEISGRYVSEIPLNNRNLERLAFPRSRRDGITGF